MSDIVKRLRDADTTRRIGESYADTHERRQRDREDAADRIEQLEAENASLATWQCEFTDGKTGLVYGQGGTTFCIMAKRMQQLEAEVKVWQGHAKTAIWSDSEECKFLTARIEQLEAALRPLCCTCDRAASDECSRAEVNCAFWNARAALGEERT